MNKNGKLLRGGEESVELDVLGVKVVTRIPALIIVEPPPKRFLPYDAKTGSNLPYFMNVRKY